MDSLPKINIGSPSKEEYIRYFSKLPKIEIPSHFSKQDKSQSKDDEGKISYSEDELSVSFKEFLEGKIKRQPRKSIKTTPDEMGILIETPAFKEKKTFLQTNFIKTDLFSNIDQGSSENAGQFLNKGSNMIELNNNKEAPHVIEEKIQEENGVFVSSKEGPCHQMTESQLDGNEQQ